MGTLSVLLNFLRDLSYLNGRVEERPGRRARDAKVLGTVSFHENPAATGTGRHLNQEQDGCQFFSSTVKGFN